MVRFLFIMQDWFLKRLFWEFLSLMIKAIQFVEKNKNTFSVAQMAQSTPKL